MRGRKWGDEAAGSWDKGSGGGRKLVSGIPLSNQHRGVPNVTVAPREFPSGISVTYLMQGVQRMIVLVVRLFLFLKLSVFVLLLLCGT